MIDSMSKKQKNADRENDFLISSSREKPQFETSTIMMLEEKKRTKTIEDQTELPYPSLLLFPSSKISEAQTFNEKNIFAEQMKTKIRNEFSSLESEGDSRPFDADQIIELSQYLAVEPYAKVEWRRPACNFHQLYPVGFTERFRVSARLSEKMLSRIESIQGSPGTDLFTAYLRFKDQEKMVPKVMTKRKALVKLKFGDY